MYIMNTVKRGVFTLAAGTILGLAGATAAAAQACPDWRPGGVPITTDAETAWTAQQYPMYAGGSLDLSQCQDVPGVGYITTAPNFSLSYDDRGMGRDLEIRVDSQCDTTLLVNSASAEWSFNDDTNGSNPSLRLPAAISGRYDLWIGTYSNTACQATLYIESFPPSVTPGPNACPDWSLGGAEVRLNAGQHESRPVNAGGAINLFESNCEIPGHGYVSAAPNFSLYFDNAGQVSTLDISVQGECDQTLLINDSSANWLFNDDDQSLQPRLQIPDAASGRYDIWVGAFGSGCQSTISFDAVSAQQGGGAPSK